MHIQVSVTFRWLTAVWYPGSFKSLCLTGLPRLWPLLDPKKQGNLPRLVWDSRSTQVVVWSDTPRGQAHRWWSPEARTDCRTQPPCPERESMQGGGCACITLAGFPPGPGHCLAWRSESWAVPGNLWQKWKVSALVTQYIPGFLSIFPTCCILWETLGWSLRKNGRGGGRKTTLHLKILKKASPIVENCWQDL